MNLPIEPVLMHYGADRIHGHGWVPIRCPFHDDATASASVNKDLNAFRCHGCGVKGNTVTLIMEMEHRSGRDLEYRAARSKAEELCGGSYNTVRSSARRIDALFD